jgi:hypothetical protein
MRSFRCLLLAIAFLCPAITFAQGGILQGPSTIFGPQGQFKAGITVTVCALGSTVTGGLCAPQEIDTNCCFTDQSLTVHVTQPILTDAFGNVNVFAAPGTYLVSLSGGNTLPVTQVWTVACVPANLSNCGALLGQANNWTAPQLFSNLNNVLYVGGPFASLWGGGDIGSQINAAYAALPASGGGIGILPQVGGGCALFSTPSVLNTSGKYAILQGGEVSSAGGVLTAGTCIQYTHTTATAALTIDWTPAAGGSYVSGSGIRDLTILNSSTDLGSTPCETNGGCASLATGIKVGGTNGGTQLADYRNVSVKGFGKGIDSSGSLGIGWAMNFYNVSLAYNTIGHLSDGTEGDTWYGGSISVNGTGVKLTAGGSGAANKRFIGTHFDSNTVLGIDGTTAGSCGTIDLIGTHEENLGTSNVAYANCAGGAGTINLIGGEAQDDSTSGSAAPYWFTANYMNCSGVTLFQNSGTRPPPTSLFVATSGGDCRVINNAGSVLTGTLGLANIPHSTSGSGVASEMGAPHFQSGQSAAPGAVWASGSGTGGALTCSVLGSDSLGTITCLTGSNGGTPGTNGTVQLNFVKAFTGTRAGCNWSMNQQNLAAGVWPGTSAVFTLTTTNTTATLQWFTNGAALSTSTNYAWDYKCHGE